MQTEKKKNREFFQIFFDPIEMCVFVRFEMYISFCEIIRFFEMCIHCNEWCARDKHADRIEYIVHYYNLNLNGIGRMMNGKFARNFIARTYM